MDSERRAHPRFPLILAVQYAGAEHVLDHTENLSASGLFIRTERAFVAGERVSLVVSFPQLLEPLELQVEIVRRRTGDDGGPAGVAVRVPDDCVEDRARLAEVARRIAGARPPDPSFRILLAEDNALVASMYAAALKRLAETDGVPAFGIEVASDGAAAFDRLLRTPAVDVLVTDVFMPVLSGITLVEKLRAEASLAHLPVIVITSGGDAERERLSALGVTLFLRKPVSYADLAATVRGVLEGSRAGARHQPAPSSEEPLAERLTGGGRVDKSELDAKPASRR
jgi:uncharacterized protein (TIGR02266 family)